MYMREYIGKIQLIHYSLRSSDHPVSETIHISTILVGLSVEYEHIVVVITASRQPYDLAGFSIVLLNAEARQHDNLLQISPNSTAFSVQTTNGSNAGQVNTRSSSAQYSSQSPTQYSSQQLPQYQPVEGFAPQNYPLNSYG